MTTYKCSYCGHHVLVKADSVENAAAKAHDDLVFACGLRGFIDLDAIEVEVEAE